MTSLSKIFRSINTISEAANVKEIAIRNLRPPVSEGMKEELTMEAVLKERELLLNEARQEIELEKSAIAKMRETASSDITAMQEAWQQEKNVLQQQAYDEGFQVGFEEGRNKALADMQDAIQRANDITRISQENAEKYLESQERVILDLAMTTAERILGLKLEEDEDAFLTIVKRGLKEAREMKEVKLYVSSEYFPLLSENRTELAAIFPPDVPFLIFANEDFDSTECTIETNHGRIVVSVDEQLNELKEKLVEILEGGE
ncbi:flagellar assembly protein FliH [Sporosarcina sp. Te-1]|uniref:flagellar assembly protein FliH n=1 Tax=Sporosarcina sp. Te-1 TaxID=2818390 RepID=UPI001A9F9542|nr:flagellar assembly protein FliH [Sporosarcina sp. Te-1]QTD42328.1 flagellar assembly protein FliH [Sporosarcina sp. Te-1]